MAIIVGETGKRIKSDDTTDDALNLREKIESDGVSGCFVVEKTSERFKVEFLLSLPSFFTTA